jgi:hypothetical protein
MSFIQRELDKLETELLAAEHGSPLYERIYAARQALSWALDPNGFASPYAMLLDKRGDNSATIEWADGPLPEAA